MRRAAWRICAGRLSFEDYVLVQSKQPSIMSTSYQLYQELYFIFLVESKQPSIMSSVSPGGTPSPSDGVGVNRAGVNTRVIQEQQRVSVDAIGKRDSAAAWTAVLKLRCLQASKQKSKSSRTHSNPGTVPGNAFTFWN